MKNNYINVNPSKIHDELLTVGIVPISVESDVKIGEYIAENTWITFEEDVDITKVDEIVTNHNPIPVALPTLEERLASAEEILTMLMGV
ncbi:hypothetical protein [Clostridium sp. C2-6-12]|uniref:hypothetical protein n=1 Tax=Clostridium sp. C2-6-12 TaxID=2698832 RepID=UPI00136EDAC5|nr:hypothetical protein [Clostridium sp. C2-6-12]